MKPWSPRRVGLASERSTHVSSASRQVRTAHRYVMNSMEFLSWLLHFLTVEVESRGGRKWWHFQKRVQTKKLSLEGGRVKWFIGLKVGAQSKSVTSYRF